MRANRKKSAPNPARSSAFFSVAAVVLLWTGAFSLSCRIPANECATLPAGAAESAAGKITDTARTAISKYFYAQADTFFHRGVGEMKSKTFQGTFFQRLSSDVTPEEHAHLSGQSIKEIMPWLKFAMQADPQNSEYAATAAFWLAGQGGRLDLAHEVLRVARINNPRNCELIVEQGRLYVRQGRFDDARRLLDMALWRWPGQLDPTGEDALQLKREILIYTALLDEESGNKQAAIADLHAVLAIFPGMESLRQRIQNLENGTEPANSARTVLQNLIVASEGLRGTCGREDQDHAKHDGSPHEHE